MEGRPIIGYKSGNGGKYHLKHEPDYIFTLCARVAPVAFKRNFETVKDLNICKHCALEFERKGY